jgi:hypothetical protein
MATFPKLPPPFAQLVTTLFPPAAETADLAIALQEWGRHEIELSPAQIRQTLDAIRTHASRRAQRLAWNSPHGILRDTAEEVLEQWRQLERILEAGQTE